MTRTMYDAIYPTNIPKGAQVVASYVDGKWPNFNEAVTLFPNARHLSIAVFAKDDAMCLDVEQFDATPQEAPGWVARQRERGYKYPIVYMNTATWPSVRAEMKRQGVPEPLYWVADYSRPPGIFDGAIGHQYQGTTAPGYDVSIIADYVPGLDPAPIEGPSEMNTADWARLEAELDKRFANLKVNSLLTWDHKQYGSIETFLSGIPGYVPVANRPKPKTR